MRWQPSCAARRRRGRVPLLAERIAASALAIRAKRASTRSLSPMAPPG
jgi:hypothetical protein